MISTSVRFAQAALALVALAMLVAVPPGYMVGGGEGDGLARIVICTGHGPVEAAIDLGKAAPAKSGKSGQACAAAVHARAAPIPASPNISVAWTPIRPPAPRLASQVAVGRGLAVPPPARAPPILV